MSSIEKPFGPLFTAPYTQTSETSDPLLFPVRQVVLLSNISSNFFLSKDDELNEANSRIMQADYKINSLTQDFFRFDVREEELSQLIPRIFIHEEIWPGIWCSYEELDSNDIKRDETLALDYQFIALTSPSITTEEKTPKISILDSKIIKYLQFTPIIVKDPHPTAHTGYMSLNEINQVNQDVLKLTQDVAKSHKVQVAWIQLLANPNQFPEKVIDIDPIIVDNELDPSSLIALGAHLLEEDPGDAAEDGFVTISPPPQRAALFKRNF